MLLGKWSEFIFIKIADDICKQSNTSLENFGLDKISNNLYPSDMLKELLLKVA